MKKKHLYLYLNDNELPQLEHVINTLAVLKLVFYKQVGLQHDKVWKQDIPLMTQRIPENVQTYVYATANNDFGRDEEGNMVNLSPTQHAGKIVKMIKHALENNRCDTVFAQMQDEEVMNALCEDEFVKDNKLFCVTKLVPNPNQV